MGGDKRSVDRTPRDFLAAWGRGDAGPVPCGACTACCHYPGIVVDERRDRKRLAHLLTERSPDGELVLQRRSDGACAHLGERGCTVYEQRPSVCRTFDCRVFAAMGLVEHCGPNHQTPDWEFPARHSYPDGASHQRRGGIAPDPGCLSRRLSDGLGEALSARPARESDR